MRKSIVRLLSLSLLVAPTARADEAADIARHRANVAQQKAMQESNRGIPVLPGKKRIDDIITVALEDGKLVVKSPLFKDDAAKQFHNRQVRINVDGLEGTSNLVVQPIGNNAFFFNFSNVSFPDADSTSNLSINLNPGQFQISRHVGSRLKQSNVSLTQMTPGSIYGQASGVQLNVNSNDNNGRLNKNANFAEPDFATLRRKHPREVNEHLRPLLRELRLESVFTVDPTTAWQVFADEWKGNPEVAAQIAALVAGLEADDYAQREKARQAIKKLGPEAALVIYRMDRGGLTDEQNCQLDTVLAGQSSVSRPDAQRMLDDTDFLLDCLYSDDLAIRTTALKHLARVAKRDLTFDPAADYDKRVVAIEILRGEVSRSSSTTKPAKAK